MSQEVQRDSIQSSVSKLLGKLVRLQKFARNWKNHIMENKFFIQKSSLSSPGRNIPEFSSALSIAVLLFVAIKILFSLNTREKSIYPFTFLL